MKRIKLALPLVWLLAAIPWTIARGEIVEFLIAVDPISADAAPNPNLVPDVSQALKNRADRLGVAGIEIQTKDTNLVVVKLIGIQTNDVASARRLIGVNAILEFRLVHVENRELLELDVIPPGYEKLLENRIDPGGKETKVAYLVNKKPERGFSGRYVKHAYADRDYLTGQPRIAFELTSVGAKLFADITEANVGRQLAIVLDGQLYSAPTIQEPIIGGHGVINGTFSEKEAQELATLLENPLEARIRIIQENVSSDPALEQSRARRARLKMIFVTVMPIALFGFLAAVVALVLYLVIASARKKSAPTPPPAAPPSLPT